MINYKVIRNSILAVVFGFILFLVFVITIEVMPDREKSDFEPYVESMDDIDIPVWGVAVPTERLLRATSLQPLPDGGAVVVGFCFHDERIDYYLTRIDGTGTLAWQRAYGGPRREDMEGDVSEAETGGFVFAGFTNSFSDGIDSVGWVLRTNGSGDVSWSRLLGHDEDSDKIKTVKPLPGGGYVVAGYTDATTSYTRGNWWIVRLNNGGAIAWQFAYGGRAKRDSVQDVVPTIDGGFLCVGETRSFGAGSGEIVWQRMYGTPGNDWANSVSVTDDGDILVAGSCEPEDEELPVGLLMRLDGTGVPLWSRSYTDAGKVLIYDAGEASDGGLLVLGRVSPASVEDEDPVNMTFILKLAPDGRPELARSSESVFGADIGIDVQVGSIVPTNSEGVREPTSARSVSPDGPAVANIVFATEVLFSSTDVPVAEAPAGRADK